MILKINQNEKNTILNNCTPTICRSADKTSTKRYVGDPGMIKICIWKRKREGNLMDSHPTIEQAIELFNNNGRG